MRFPSNQHGNSLKQTQASSERRRRARLHYGFMDFRFRQSMCNEAFEKWPFGDACRAIRKAGYDGIEIAPFTLAENPADMNAADRRQCRDILTSEGLAFVGLHW